MNQPPGRRLAGLMALGLWPGSAGAAPLDLTELSLEQLMAVEVQSVSKYAQNTLDAPSAVTVLTAEDFRIRRG
jgi:outer membrane receptor for ferrienterochelin and colicin